MVWLNYLSLYVQVLEFKATNLNQDFVEPQGSARGCKGFFKLWLIDFPFDGASRDNDIWQSKQHDAIDLLNCLQGWHSDRFYKSWISY